MAYKLILSVEDSKNHDKWLEVRAKGIGGSDAGAILGLNKYRSPSDVWMEKTGAREAEDLTDNEAVRAGILLEPIVAQMFEEDTGKKVNRRGTLQSCEYPFMLANVDRMVQGENAGLEIKTAGGWSAKLWEGDEVPDSYYIQCLHYMAVTGARRWYIAALIGGQHFIWKTIERNEEDIALLIREEAKFWNEYVLKDVPPPVDSSEACGKVLAYRYQNATPGSMIDLPEEAGEVLKSLDSNHETMELLKKEEQFYKNKLMDMMKENECGIWTDADGSKRKVTWKAPKPSETVKLSDIKKKAPDEYQALKDLGLVTLRASSRRLTIQKK